MWQQWQISQKEFTFSGPTCSDWVKGSSLSFLKYSKSWITMVRCYKIFAGQSYSSSVRTTSAVIVLGGSTAKYERERTLKQRFVCRCGAVTAAFIRVARQRSRANRQITQDKQNSRFRFARGKKKKKLKLMLPKLSAASGSGMKNKWLLVGLKISDTFSFGQELDVYRFTQHWARWQQLL